MKNRFLNIGTQILGWIGFILFLGAAFVPELHEILLSFIPEWAQGIFGAGSAMLAAGPVTGPVTHETTNTEEPNHFERDVSQIITFKRPHDYPLDTLIRMIGKKEKARQFKVEWEEVDVRPASDTTTAGYTIQAGTAGETAVLTVANVSMWAVDDTGRVGDVDGSTAGEEFRFVVTAVDDDNDQISVSGLNGFNTAGDAGVDGNRVPSIASGSTLYRMGNAKTELDAQTTEKYQIPGQFYNYCETFMAQLSESEIESHMRAYSGYDYGDKKNLALWDFRSQLESTHLFGHRRERIIGSDRHYFAGGIIPSISNTIEFGSGAGAVNPTVDDVIDMTEVVFSPNRGSRKRYAFCGSTLVSGLDKIPVGDRRIRATEEKVTAGFSVTKLISSHGEVVVIPSKQLDRQGWGNKAVIVDFENLVKKELIPLKAVPLELNKSGQKRVINAYRLEETCCIQTRYAGTDGVHAIWEPSQAT